MTKGKLLNMITDYAKEYCPKAKESIVINKHMNEYEGQEIDQDTIDALIVDFVNFIAGKQWLDWALYTRDLKED